ncbi:TPA: CHAP domain-containing protein [Staphylococcus aureus]
MKKLAFAITATSGAAAFLTHHDAQASTQHTVQSGESLWSIAQKYNTSVESIKQNNQLDNNLVFPGQVISVGGSDAQNSSNTSPQAGSASSHTVQAGESLNIIASRYGGSGGTTPTATTGSNGNASSFNHQNLYTAGQCTWYVFDRRAQAGSPISTYWSDAKYWAGNAANDGYQVNNTPSVGSIMQSTPGPYGHVAYVERVNGDGSILISEMNYTYGPYNMNYRTIPASEVSSYAFIH